MSRRLLGCCIVAALVAAGSLPAAAQGRRMYPMNVSAEGVRTVTFDVQEGDLVVRGDPQASRIEMRVAIDRAWLFRLGEQGILEKLIKVAGAGTDHVTVKTNIEPSWRNWFRAEYPIDFEIVVPARLALVVKDTSGKIEISAMGGDVDVEDGSGALAVNDIRGALHIRKASGDIHVAGITGPTTIDSESGQMKLRSLAALDVRASNGNLDIAKVERAEIHNRDGNITIAGVAGPLSIEDDSGEIYAADVSGAIEIHDTSGQVRLERVAAVTVYDTSGDLRVNRAASLDLKQKESGQVKLQGITGQVSLPPGIVAKRE